MKENRFLKVVSVILSAMCFVGCCVGCGSINSSVGNSESSNDELVKKDGDGRNFQQAFLDPIDQDKYLVGMCALTSETMSTSTESNSTAEWVAKNDGVLGVKSQRVWMHLSIVLIRDANSNKLTINQYAADKYHDFFKQLKDNGVERIVAMNHQFLYPYDYDKLKENDRQVFIHPLEEAEFYKDWIQMYYEAYKLMATEFPEVKFWECGNEFDHKNFAHRNNEELMTVDDVGFISADLCYAANKAIKEVDPNNACVYPGLAGIPGLLEATYKHIVEKKLPTLEEYYFDDPDDYFDIVAWHDYPNSEGYDHVKKRADDMYAIMQEYGDAEKRVFLTECGYSSSDPEKFEEVAETLKGVWTNVRQSIPYIETIFFFRMTDLYEQYNSGDEKENYFGLFYSPNDPVNMGKPKPVAIELYKFVHGEDADTTPLYWYYNEKMKIENR